MKVTPPGDTSPSLRFGDSVLVSAPLGLEMGSLGAANEVAIASGAPFGMPQVDDCEE
jgi:hypothetical protein